SDLLLNHETAKQLSTVPPEGAVDRDKLDEVIESTLSAEWTRVPSAEGFLMRLRKLDDKEARDHPDQKYCCEMAVDSSCAPGVAFTDDKTASPSVYDYGYDIYRKLPEVQRQQYDQAVSQFCEDGHWEEVDEITSSTSSTVEGDVYEKTSSFKTRPVIDAVRPNKKFTNTGSYSASYGGRTTTDLLTGLRVNFCGPGLMLPLEKTRVLSDSADEIARMHCICKSPEKRRVVSDFAIKDPLTRSQLAAFIGILQASNPLYVHPVEPIGKWRVPLQFKSAEVKLMNRIVGCLQRDSETSMVSYGYVITTLKGIRLRAVAMPWNPRIHALVAADAVVRSDIHKRIKKGVKGMERLAVRRLVSTVRDILLDWQDTLKIDVSLNHIAGVENVVADADNGDDSESLEVLATTASDEPSPLLPSTGLGGEFLQLVTAQSRALIGKDRTIGDGNEPGELGDLIALCVHDAYRGVIAACEKVLPAARNSNNTANKQSFNGNKQMLTDVVETFNKTMGNAMGRKKP
ncbi:hypothetical protein FOZ61_001693, partial [Perkinsus olseni]